jgi:argonaute family protein
MGFYLYSFGEEFKDYDFIVGYDITKERDEFSDKIKGIGGSAIVYNNRGHVLTTITFEHPHTSSEIAEYDKLFAMIYSELVPHLDLEKNKVIRILLLKDGNIFKDELEKLSRLSKKYNFEIVYMNVIKSTILRFFKIKKDEIKGDEVLPDEKNMYAKFGGCYYISAHFYRGFLKRPVKISEKYLIKNGVWEKVDITEKDIRLLILLTKINFSQLMPDKMRLPAPVHYAHKHVNAVRRGWQVKDIELLRSGCLPTI